MRSSSEFEANSCQEEEHQVAGICRLLPRPAQETGRRRTKEKSGPAYRLRPDCVRACRRVRIAATCLRPTEVVLLSHRGPPLLFLEPLATLACPSFASRCVALWCCQEAPELSLQKGKSLAVFPLLCHSESCSCYRELFLKSCPPPSFTRLVAVKSRVVKHCC